MSFPADEIPEGQHALVERLRKGDVDAFDVLLRFHWRGVVLFAAQALSDPEAAQDVGQETFIRLWRARAEMTSDRLRAYLYRVARNLVIDELRRRDVRTRWAQHPPVEPEHATSPDQLLFKQELDDAVANAIHALPARRREAFSLAFLHGLSYKEVALAMGISVSTVKNQIAAALADLRAALATHDPE